MDGNATRRGLWLVGVTAVLLAVVLRSLAARDPSGDSIPSHQIVSVQGSASREAPPKEPLLPLETWNRSTGEAPTASPSSPEPARPELDPLDDYDVFADSFLAYLDAVGGSPTWGYCFDGSERCVVAFQPDEDRPLDTLLEALFALDDEDSKVLLEHTSAIALPDHDPSDETLEPGYLLSMFVQLDEIDAMHFVDDMDRLGALGIDDLEATYPELFED